MRLAPPLTEAALRNPKWKLCKPGDEDFDAWVAEGYPPEQAYRLCRSERRAALHFQAENIRAERKAERKLKKELSALRK